jgi:polar amino acid transport system substrate-binding protein
VAVCLLACAAHFSAADLPPLAVGVSPFTPFVIVDGDEPLRGYSVDLWKQVSVELGRTYRFVHNRGVADKLRNLTNGGIDVAIGGISITEDRERVIDFSHPYFHTGLGILVKKKSSLSVGTFLETFLTRKRLTTIGIFLLLVFVAGHIIWLVERKQDSGKRSFNRRYLPGIFEGMYWSVVTASTVGYGDRVPRSWAGRLLAIMLIISFLPFFAFFIARLSSDITLHELHTVIEGPRDLLDRQVGVVRGTTSQAVVAALGADMMVYDTSGDACGALLENELDAVVYDRPNLQYYARTEGRDRVEVVDAVFAPQDYGIAVVQGSDLREEINRALLAMIENGQMARIHSKWFGSTP